MPFKQTNPSTRKYTKERKKGSGTTFTAPQARQKRRLSSHSPLPREKGMKWEGLRLGKTAAADLKGEWQGREV